MCKPQLISLNCLINFFGSQAKFGSQATLIWSTTHINFQILLSLQVLLIVEYNSPIHITFNCFEFSSSKVLWIIIHNPQYLSNGFEFSSSVVHM